MFENKYQEKDYVELIDLMREEAGVAPCEQWPDAFHPTVGETDVIRAAKSLCQACPIINACALYGIKWENEGIYGGLTAVERKYARAGLIKAGKPVAKGMAVRTRAADPIAR